MNDHSKPSKQVNLQWKANPHAIALREFTKYTIQNPDFFKLSADEQQKKAMEFVEKYKMDSENTKH